MKNFGILALGLIFLSGMMVGCSSKSSDNSDFIIEEIDSDQVLNYNDNLRTISLNCFEEEESMWSVYNDYNGGSADDVKSAIDKTVSICKDAMLEINNLGDWEGDNSLKNGVILLIQKKLEKYEKLYETLPFLPLLDSGLTEEDTTIYEGIKQDLDSLDGEIEKLNEKLVDVQRGFAERHGYELEE